jgi:alpha-amylase/alpha-mannosidase (GH57 family)
VLFHLAWTGFAVRAEEKMLGELEKKGAGFSEDEKIALLDLMSAQAARVLPEWRALSESGQVELVSSPFYHPIVPLLCDTDAALRAMPDARLPFRFAFPEDGREQIRRAQAAHARAFGRPPRGMWPP